MTVLNRELVFLILQFLDEEKFKETMHRLEQESGFYFNMRHFENLVINGEWDEVEKYLSSFTKVDDNKYSTKIFFEIRKLKYFEELDRQDRPKALDILIKDLKVFSTYSGNVFKEITELLTLDNFRDNEQLSRYGDIKSARGIMLAELKRLISANPVFHDKLQLPTFKNARLRTLINQSLNWQHGLCVNPQPNPELRTLFLDHNCGQPNGAQCPSLVTTSFLGAVPRPGGFQSLSAHGFSPAALLPNAVSGWMAGPSLPSVSPGFIGLAAPNNGAATLKRPRTRLNNSSMDYQTADSEHVSKRSRLFGTAEVIDMPVNVFPVALGNQSQGQSSNSSHDLPSTVIMTLNQGSAVKSMDFHPVQQYILVVGTNVGDVIAWELSSREKIATIKFKIWNVGVCSMALQESLANDHTVSVNRVRWSPDGNLFGVAYSKNIVHLFSYQGGDGIRNFQEIEAHLGSVNDIAFSYPNKQLCIVTGGEDRLIKVWDATTGAKKFTFDGHEAPIYSICPHCKDNIQFIFSTATDGKVKVWLYDNMGSRIDYDAPGYSSIVMAYSADGTRLFSCGTNKEGNSFLVEWNECEGTVKHAYHGLGKQSAGVVQFDTNKNQILAAGDQFLVKFWEMDNCNLLTSIRADGGLQASPCVKFSREGTLLAVSTNDDGVKILANTDGIKLLQIKENCIFDGSRVGSMSVSKNCNSRGLVDIKSRSTDESADRTRICRVTEINEPSQCQTLRLPDTSTATKVLRLMYTFSGTAIIALASNAEHKIWKWPRSEHNISFKATPSIEPQLWQPASGTSMANDMTETDAANPVSCFALSSNGSYLMSSSGGLISLYNLVSFKMMTTVRPLPPLVATFLVFHPQDNNIIAIGMKDSTIQIYNVRIDEFTEVLKGHQQKITGLAVSNVLNVLVSSGADSQLCVWSMDGWEKLASKFLQVPAGRAAGPLSDTQVQFHLDQKQFLAVHDTQIAIYEAPKLECKKQWFPREATGPITHAAYSCDSQLIYVCFGDGSIDVLTCSTLRLRCRINSSAYLPPNPRMRVYPLVIVAHPSKPNQFALGLTDGGVHVLEPLESEGKWGNSPTIENGAGPTTATGGLGSDQHQRQLHADAS